MEEIARGALSKMTARLESNAPVQYAFRLDDREVAVNPLIGRPLRLEYLGSIFCTHCGRKTKKSFSQGYCYPCFTRLAQCDSCIVSPEKCHYEQGTCREPEWGERFCMTDHVVYLANSSGVKVGITRASQIPTRWIDQGARQALPILRVATRQQSGLVEDLLRSQVADRTNWRAMLRAKPSRSIWRQSASSCSTSAPTACANCSNVSACRRSNRLSTSIRSRSPTRSRPTRARSPASTWKKRLSSKARFAVSRAST